MIDPEVLSDLVAIGLSKRALKEVIAVLNKIYAKQEERLSSQRQRSKKYRDKAKSTTSPSRDDHVTVTSPERDAHISNISTYVEDTSTALLELDKLNHDRQPKQKKSRGIRLPETWEPSYEDQEYARAAGYSDVQIFDYLAPQFRDHWVSASGSKAVKRDWVAAWRCWVRNAVKWNSPAPASSSTSIVVPFKHHQVQSRENNRAVLASVSSEIDAFFQDRPTDSPALVRIDARVVSSVARHDQGKDAGHGGNLFDLPGEGPEGNRPPGNGYGH